jgi:dipeptidyl aminopeptidase/acylaminoacyl peptidase
MRKIKLLTISLAACLFMYGQKKPLDHSVYDGWQAIGEKLISNDGKWAVYTINPQEGDNELIIQSTNSSNSYKKSIPRGYSAVITEDNRFVICKIKSFYKDIRDARIKRKRGDDLPKDSFCIVEPANQKIWKFARVKSFKTPEKGFGWVAYHLEKKPEPPASKNQLYSAKTVDSLNRIIDSLEALLQPKPSRPTRNIDYMDADEDTASGSPINLPTDLVLRNLSTGDEKIFKNILEYKFSDNGQRILMEQARDPKEVQSQSQVFYYDLNNGKQATLSRGGNDFRNFAISEDGIQVAFLAERDAKPKDLQKFYKLWYYKEGMDSAIQLVDKNTGGVKLGSTISEFGQVSFSKNGKRLFFGTAPIQPPKDTMLVDFELAKLDIWHYNDDYIQPTQLFRLRRDLQENFLAVYLLDQHKMLQLGSKEIPSVIQTAEGDGNSFVGISDFGKRIESQWEGNTKKDIYSIDPNTGVASLIKKDLLGTLAPNYPSPTGKYIVWYDNKDRNYYIWNGKATLKLTEKIKVPLYDEEHDSPSDPPAYGVMGWHNNDSAVYIYDRYDVWKLDPEMVKEPQTITSGRKLNNVYRFLRLDSTQRYFTGNSPLFFRVQNKTTKETGIDCVYDQKLSNFVVIGKHYCNNLVKAKDKDNFLITLESYNNSPDLFFFDGRGLSGSITSNRLTSINSQQNNYLWGSAELVEWKAYNGKESEGIVYKPENFDPSKKYPMICYFYETLTDGLYNYLPPAPTPSRLNIPFFVSRGYVVFAPDIHYGTGHPGKDAYDYIVSGARALVKKGYVDSTRIGLQGQSWGGYQVAYLITVTNFFKAAWAGAPVVNMFSAYGGIRWESGLNRQFQYEHGQSRIGASIWEKPQLYIDNSPLFKLPKVKTPLVIMANDADGAVPWYQGIEMFTAMRRLGKKVWMLTYNGEAHNLVERRNRKDIQIREQQFFDWQLKGERPTRWLTEGVPAINKGKDWGLN